MVLVTPVVRNDGPSHRRPSTRCGDTSLRLAWVAPTKRTPLDHELPAGVPAGTCICCGADPINQMGQGNPPPASDDRLPSTGCPAPLEQGGPGTATRPVRRSPGTVGERLRRPPPVSP